jgi:AraC-like DNA-binding protein
MDSLVQRSGLSARQFQRRFTAQVGLSPKLYARTIRFDAALIAHRDTPAKPWTEIVHEAGYFDHAHFVRERHALVALRQAADEILAHPRFADAAARLSIRWSGSCRRPLRHPDDGRHRRHYPEGISRRLSSCRFDVIAWA